MTFHGECALLPEACRGQSNKGWKKGFLKGPVSSSVVPNGYSPTEPSLSWKLSPQLLVLHVNEGEPFSQLHVNINTRTCTHTHAHTCYMCSRKIELQCVKMKEREKGNQPEKRQTSQSGTGPKGMHRDSVKDCASDGHPQGSSHTEPPS